jgi:hypothetical protein
MCTFNFSFIANCSLSSHQGEKVQLIQLPDLQYKWFKYHFAFNLQKLKMHLPTCAWAKSAWHLAKFLLQMSKSFMSCIAILLISDKKFIQVLTVHHVFWTYVCYSCHNCYCGIGSAPGNSETKLMTLCNIQWQVLVAIGLQLNVLVSQQGLSFWALTVTTSLRSTGSPLMVSTAVFQKHVFYSRTALAVAS